MTDTKLYRSRQALTGEVLVTTMDEITALWATHMPDDLHYLEAFEEVMPTEISPEHLGRTTPATRRRIAAVMGLDCVGAQVHLLPFDQMYCAQLTINDQINPAVWQLAATYEGAMEQAARLVRRFVRYEREGQAVVMEAEDCTAGQRSEVDRLLNKVMTLAEAEREFNIDSRQTLTAYTDHRLEGRQTDDGVILVTRASVAALFKNT